MYLIDPLAEKAEKRSWIFKGFLLYTGLFVLCFWVILSLFRGPQQELITKRLVLPQVNFEKIGAGGWALRPPVQQQDLLPLVEELVLIGRNSRPDGSALPTIKLGLKSGGNQQEVICGQKLFISDNCLAFSHLQTEFSVTPLSILGSGVLVELAKGDQREELVLHPSKLFQQSFENEEFFQVVKKGQFWGRDLFLQHWGGDEYQDLSFKQKVEIGGRIYFITTGDFLFWDGDVWKIGKPPLANFPLMKVIAAHSQHVQLEVWDGHGFHSSVVQMTLQPVPKSLLKPEEIMTAVRSKAPDEVTCQLGKRRVTVKEGDWWVHHEGRWKILKNSYELEAFLIHEIPGELFIFEKIENGKEKVTLKARSFDRMRTRSEPISLVFNIDKKMPQNSMKHLARASALSREKIAVKHLHRQNDKEEKQ